MKLDILSEEKDGLVVHRRYSCPCGQGYIKPSGKVILHLGKTDTVDMAEELSQRATNWFEEIYRGCEDVKSIEKHGIKDKGATVEHQFLFLQKK